MGPLHLSDRVQNSNEAKNWIERSDPLGSDLFEQSSNSAAAYFSLGIDGKEYELGFVSQKFYSVMMEQANKRFTEVGGVPDQLIPIYATFAMDSSAKEAVKMALEQNGVEMIEDDTEAAIGNQLWGEVENIKISTENNASYDSFQEAVESGEWKPGTDFSFVVRNVKARVNTLSNDIRKLNQSSSFQTNSLKEMSEDAVRRCNEAPISASVKGYAPWKAPDVIPRADLSIDSINVDRSENEVIAAEIMDSLRNHGYLIVDLGKNDGTGHDDNDYKSMTGMWKSTEMFFEAAINAEKKGEEDLFMPTMQVAEGVGSKHAVYGYQLYAAGGMRFLETRLNRKDQSILPYELEDIISYDKKDLIDAFYTLADVGKDVTRIAVASAAIKKNLFITEAPKSFDAASFQRVKASSAALQLVNELIDDGRPCLSLPMDEGLISMSPHRMCSYSGESSDEKSEAKEVFGAHTDTSFITIVPVASVSGLETFDEEAGAWIRPELVARRHFEEERSDEGLDPNVQEVEVFSSAVSEMRPWHARYVSNNHFYE